MINMAKYFPQVYNCSIVLYNRCENETAGEEQYFGTRFDNIRVAISRAADIQAGGLETANTCTVMIPKADLPKPYLPFKLWDRLTAEDRVGSFTISTIEKDFFVIAKKADSGIDIDLPVGIIHEDSKWSGGWYQYCKGKYEHVYLVKTLDEPVLMPSFAIGGR